MKRVSLTLFSLFITIACYAQGELYSLKGRIRGVSNKAKVYLQYNLNHKSVVDSTQIDNEKFEFSGMVSEPVQAFLSLNDKGTGPTRSNMVDLYLENGNILLSSDDQMISHATIEGTPANKDKLILAIMTKPSSDKYLELMKRKNAATEVERQSPEFQREIDSLELISLHESAAAKKAFIIKHPNSVVSLIQLTNLKFFKIPTYELQALYDNLSLSLRKTNIGMEFSVYLRQSSLLNDGSKAPDFQLPDINGKRYSLDAFKGNYILLDFWASWCVPCREENPNLVKIAKRYHSKNFIIISVSLDRQTDRSKWVAAIEADGLTWLQLSDLRGMKSEPALLYNVNSIPQNFLIAPNGIIVDKNLRGPELQRKLEAIFSGSDNN
jgi:thiol-disulfide isomerase/thioredoxin